MKSRPTSIKTRITWSLLVIVVIGLAPYEIMNYLQVEERLNSELESQADRKILRLTQNLVIPLWEMDEEWIDKMIDVEMMDHNAYAIQVRGDEQLLVARFRNEQGQSVKGSVQPPEKDFVMRRQDVLHDNARIGQVQIFLSKRGLQAQLQNEALAAAIRALVLIFLIVLFLGAALNQLVVKPLFRILKVVNDVANGHYNATITEKRDDELGLLAEGIIQMMQNLSLRETERDQAWAKLQQTNQQMEWELSERIKAQTALKELNETLEQRIHARTEDLQRSNEHLQVMGVALEKAKNEAEAANRAKSIFLSNMSHELRTPMNAVLGFSRLMQNDQDLTPTQHENLDIINRSGNHLLELINQVLDMAKIEAGRMVVENAPFDLGAMIRDIIDMMHERAESKGLNLSVDQSSSFPRFVSADAGKLRHILINLLSNSVKYTQQGEVVLRLTTYQETDDEHLFLVCEVEDTGIGIAEQDLARIFEAFVQVGQQADQHGTGLGLIITKQYAELMGGTIAVRSELGKGSIFRVEVPVVPVPEQAVEILTEAMPCRVIGLEPGQPEFKILIVEDKIENRLLLRKLLESIGINVIEAENGQEAIEAFKRWLPDFIWMDRRMPVMDGLEATRTILALPEAKNVKIAAITASVFIEERQALFKAGVCAIINKPYRNEEIFECMAKHLGLRYIYAQDDSQPIGHELDQDAVTEKLKQLPPDWLAALQTAALGLDVEQCLDVVQKIEPVDPELSKQLLLLLNQFDFDSLLKSIGVTRA